MAGEIIRGVIAFTILIIWTITPVILAFDVFVQLYRSNSNQTLTYTIEADSILHFTVGNKNTVLSQYFELISSGILKSFRSKTTVLFTKTVFKIIKRRNNSLIVPGIYKVHKAKKTSKNNTKKITKNLRTFKLIPFRAGRAKAAPEALHSPFLSILFYLFHQAQDARKNQNIYTTQADR